MVLTAVGIAMMVASFPVVLLGTAWLLAAALRIHHGWAMLLTAGAATALGGVAAAVGGRRLSHSFDSFRRSRKQLTLNLSWVRTVLVSGARLHARQAYVITAAHRARAFPSASLMLSRNPPGEPDAPADPAIRSQATMAINVQTIQGEWTYLCGLARHRWSQLTEDDLGALEGNFEQLVGRIQQKTGEGREAIEKFFADATSRGSSAVANAAQYAGKYAHHTSDRLRERYDNAESLVRHHPTETVIAALGIGLVAGLIAGLAIRAR